MKLPGSMNSPKGYRDLGRTHFNVHSWWQFIDFRPRRQVDLNCFLSGLDRAPTYRGVQMRALLDTLVKEISVRLGAQSKVGAHIVSEETRKSDSIPLLTG